MAEELRLKYRYLDLRRPEMTQMLPPGTSVVHIIREHLDERGFVDIETPILTRTTPEGARDFLVPARLFSAGRSTRCPQSPQQLKQLLMVAGQDRYYQIVRCFRDEDLARRPQPRVHPARPRDVVRRRGGHLRADGAAVRAAVAGDRRRARSTRRSRACTYDEAMQRFGSDKPDLRYGMELADLGDGVRVRRGSTRSPSVLGVGRQDQGARRRPAAAALSRKELDGLVDEAKGRGAAGLVWMAVEADGVRSPVEKFLTAEEIAAVRAATGAAEGDLILIVADRPDRVAVALDGLRRRTRRTARADPRGPLGVAVGDRAAAVRVERGGAALDGAAPPVHVPASPTTSTRRRRRLVRTTSS